MAMPGYSALLWWLAGVTGLAGADTLLLVGGEVDSLLHPSTADILAYGRCGLFSAGLPELPRPVRDTAAALLGTELVVCGGRQLAATKDCSSLDLTAWPLQWSAMPSMIHPRDRHGLVVVAGQLYAVGGSRAIGSEHSIERYNGSGWEEVGEMNGYRQDFCALAWGEEQIAVLGGYDDLGGQMGTYRIIVGIVWYCL